MRAPVALLSLFSAGTPAAPASGTALWHADELPQQQAAGYLPSCFAALDRELPGGGWPLGQLIELLLDTPGIGELSLLTPALAQIACEDRSCVWVLPCAEAGSAAAPASPTLPYAPALQQAGLNLQRSLFVRPGSAREALWAFEQALRAAHLGAVIGWLPAAGSSTADFRALRRLHLLAQRQRALVFVLRETRFATAPSPATLRLQLASHDEGLRLSLLKRRGRPLLEPLQLQVHPDHWRQAQVDTEQLPAPAAPATSPAQRWLRSLFTH